MTIALKYWIEQIIGVLLRLFWIFPLQKKCILFCAYGGRQYSGSPRAISEMLAKKHPDYKQIWAFTEPERFRNQLPPHIKCITYKSLAFLYHACTTQAYIDNVEFWSILRFRPDQTVLQTWHGGGAYKQVGSNRLDVSERERKHVIDKMSRITCFVSSSQAFTDYVIKGAFKYKGLVLSSGLPRNDIFFTPHQERSQSIRQTVGLKPNERLLLYAPTFRKDLNLDDRYLLPWHKILDALHDRFGGTWILGTRMHYYLSRKLLQHTDCVPTIELSDYPDMQDLLLIADVLITDYSSSMWDFSLTKKPCFLFAPDLQAYCTERNFYTPIQTWPFPYAETADAFVQTIRNFSEKDYLQAVADHHQSLNSFESGNACTAVCQSLIRQMEVRQ